VRELFVRWILDGQARHDAAAGEAQPAVVEEVAARIMRSEHAAADVLAAIRAAQPADATPFTLATAPLALVERVRELASTGALVVQPSQIPMPSLQSLVTAALADDARLQTGKLIGVALVRSCAARVCLTSLVSAADTVAYTQHVSGSPFLCAWPRLLVHITGALRADCQQRNPKRSLTQSAIVGRRACADENETFDMLKQRMMVALSVPPEKAADVSLFLGYYRAPQADTVMQRVQNNAVASDHGMLSLRFTPAQDETWHKSLTFDALTIIHKFGCD
jgi:hypothetical protein